MKINTIYNSNEKITIDSYLKKCGVIDVNEYLYPIDSKLDNPYDYYNMSKAVRMFLKHLENLSDAYIICDSDLDGITSTVIIYQYMKALNKDWNIDILIHKGKERGLQDEEILKHIKESPRDFIIIPDAGTNDKEQANDIKADILVLDHHDISTPIENGILINNQSEHNYDFMSVSPFGSGCLVTWMFLKALDGRLKQEWTNYLIDLVALSLISDSMDMTDQQNRIFYHFGLETNECIQNSFLRAMFDKFIGDKPYTQKDISFKIVPKFNSVIRSENQELKYQVIESFIENKDNYDDILEKCQECHKNQIQLVENIISNNEENIKQANNNNIVLLSCDDMPRSYSGLVAGKIMNLCNKPTIVGKIKDNKLIGSLRSPIPLRKELNENELVEWAVGHENSCGISIEEDNINKLVDYYNSVNLSYEPHIDVLMSYSINNIPDYIFNVFGDNLNAIWGYGIPKPIFEIHDIVYNPNDIQILGSNKRTIKIINNGISFILFNVTKQQKVDLGLGYIIDGEFYENIKTSKMCLSCVGELSVNRYRNYINNQMIIDNFNVSKYKPKTVQSVFGKE